MTKYNIPLPRLLDSSGDEIRRLNVIDASVNLNIMPLSTATLTLPEDENVDMRSWVQMYTSQGSAGVFRVRAPGRSYGGGNNTYQLDHGIVEVGDYIIKEETDESKYKGAADSVIRTIWSHYNGSKWRLGTVEPTEKVEYSGDYGNVLSALIDVMGQLPDHMMAFDFSTTPWTLNIVARPGTVGGEGRLLRNIKSARITYDDSNLCTKLYCYQAQESGSATQPSFVLDADTQRLYGVVEQTAGQENEEESAEDFRAKCLKYLNQHKHPLTSISIDGIDLQAATGESVDGYSIGSLYRLALPKQNLTIEETLVTLNWPSVYGDPSNVNVTLGNAELSISGAYGGSSGSASSSSVSSKSKSSAKTANHDHKKRIEMGGILHEAGLEWDENHVLIFANDEATGLGKMYADINVSAGKIDMIATEEDLKQGTFGKSLFQVHSDEIKAEVLRASSAEGELGSSISATASAIRTDVFAANSSIYSYIDQTASSISAVLADTESGLRHEIQLSASGLHQTISSTTNRTWVQDNDPRSAAGGEYTAKPGDIWIESTHQGSWDGAEGYDWEHDEGYDWSQIMGARIWTFQNGKWELASDKQQVISYSDLVNTAEHLISQKIAGIVNDEGLLDVYMSKLEQTATEIKSDVYSATSDIYSYIHQTASRIVIGIDSSIQKVYTFDAVKDGIPIHIGQDGVPRDADGRPLRDGDIWIDTANQETWDKALKWDWNDDAVYDWNTLRDDEIYRYDSMNQTWVPVTNGRIYTDQAEMDIADDHIKANLRSIDLVQGEMRENAHQFSVTTEEMRSTFNDRIRNMGSEFQQTTDQLRSDYYAANSKIYTRIQQTASSIRADIVNAESKMGSRISASASEIRTDVYAENSKIYSAIQQNASQIRLKVGKGDVATQLAVECGNVTISGGNLRVSGYITTNGLVSTLGSYTHNISSTGTISANKLTGGTLTLDGDDLTSKTITWIDGDITTFAADQQLDLRHYHDFTIEESGGTITITPGAATKTQTPQSFNMADTKFYKDAVSAAKASVTLDGEWDDYSGSSVGYTVTASNQKTKTVNMTLSQSGNEVQLKSGNLIRASLVVQSTGPSYTPVTYARGGLNSFNNGNSATLYYFVGAPGEESSKYRAAASGSRYWYWSSSSDTLTTLYRQS